MKQLEEEFKSVFCKMGKTMGMKDSMVNVLAVLYTEPKEIAMEDVAKRTGYSLASVSNTMKLFEDFNMVQRIRKPGTKKVFFYMEKDLLKINVKKLSRASESMDLVLQLMPPILEKYEKKVKDEDTNSRFNIMQNYYKQLSDFDIIIKKWTNELEELSRRDKHA